MFISTLPNSLTIKMCHRGVRPPGAAWRNTVRAQPPSDCFLTHSMLLNTRRRQRGPSMEAYSGKTCQDHSRPEGRVAHAPSTQHSPGLLLLAGRRRLLSPVSPSVHLSGARLPEAEEGHPVSSAQRGVGFGASSTSSLDTPVSSDAFTLENAFSGSFLFFPLPVFSLQNNHVVPKYQQFPQIVFWDFSIPPGHPTKKGKVARVPPGHVPVLPSLSPIRPRTFRSPARFWVHVLTLRGPLLHPTPVPPALSRSKPRETPIR